MRNLRALIRFIAFVIATLGLYWGWWITSFFEFAANADIPVSYVSLNYRTPEGEMPASDAVCWWEDISFMAHMFRLFSVPRFTAILHFGEQPVLNPDRKKLAQELHEKISSSFVPII